MTLPQPSAADPLRPLTLRELRLQPEGRLWRVDQPITGLESLTPVRGELLAVHHGSVLELQGRAETIVTLCCDRCLQSFNHRLCLEVRELIDLDPAGADGGSVDGVHARLIDDDSTIPCGDDLDDRLLAAGVFDPERWLFEQLHLQLPLVSQCGTSCPGPACWNLEPELADPRWAALRTLRNS